MAYTDAVLEHYNNPKNVGSLDKSAGDVGTGLVGAPECGDVMKLQIRVEDDYKMDNTTRIKYMIDTIRMIRSKMSYDIFLISNDNAIKSLIINSLKKCQNIDLK